MTKKDRRQITTRLPGPLFDCPFHACGRFIIAEPAQTTAEQVTSPDSLRRHRPILYKTNLSRRISIRLKSSDSSIPLRKTWVFSRFSGVICRTCLRLIN